MSKAKGRAWVFGKFSGLGFLSPIKAVVVIGTIISIFIVVVGFLPNLQVSNAKLSDEKRIELENANRATWIQFFGGLGLLITAYSTLQNLKIADKNLKVTEQNFYQNLKVIEEKQITERFAKAVELLGSESMHVRLGAIYALERIAEDSDKDYWQIMEIFTAYARGQSPYFPKKYAKNTEENVPSISIDVQAVLTVLTRRKKYYNKDEIHILYLAGTNLREVKINNANFKNANFIEANFQNAQILNINFDNASLQNANFQSAYFSESTSLRSANLQGANFQGANLQGLNLGDANLSGADLRDANLSGANLRNANLSGADLRNVNLSDANLRDANLSGAILRKTNLSNAKLMNANIQKTWMQEVNFRDADLSYADIRKVNTWDEEDITNNFEYIRYEDHPGGKEKWLYSDFNGVNLEGTNLEFANLIGTINLKPEQLKKANNWDKARYDSRLSEQLGIPEISNEIVSIPVKIDWI